MTQRTLGRALVVALGLAGLVGSGTTAAAQSPTRDVQQGAERTGQQVERGAERTGQEAERQTRGEEPLSDAWLTAKTKLALLADEQVSGTAINVDTANGVVSLSGQVASEQEKAKALEIARKIEGVREVRDGITVRSREARAEPSGAAAQSGTGPGKPDDEQLARQVRQQIQQGWTSGQLRLDGDTLKGPEGTAIEVSVNDGVVTLEGKVRDVREIVQAAEAARRVQGVRSVKTNIESGQSS